MNRQEFASRLADLRAKTGRTYYFIGRIWETGKHDWAMRELARAEQDTADYNDGTLFGSLGDPS